MWHPFVLQYLVTHAAWWYLQQGIFCLCHINRHPVLVCQTRWQQPRRSHFLDMFKMQMDVFEGTEKKIYQLVCGREVSYTTQRTQNMKRCKSKHFVYFKCVPGGLRRLLLTTNICLIIFRKLVSPYKIIFESMFDLWVVLFPILSFSDIISWFSKIYLFSKYYRGILPWFWT